MIPDLVAPTAIDAMELDEDQCKRLRAVTARDSSSPDLPKVRRLSRPFGGGLAEMAQPGILMTECHPLGARGGHTERGPC